VGIADYPGNTREGGDFFGSALGVAAGDVEACGGVGGVKLSNGVAGLGVSGGGHGAGVENQDVGKGGFGGRSAAAVEQLALDGGAVGLRGAATELLDEESRHLEPGHPNRKYFTRSSRGTQRSQRRGNSTL